MPKQPLTNPLALAVLVLLFERPMHPYEMAATLKERGKEQSIKFRYGSLYTVIQLLQRESFIVPSESYREGRRPERTVYELTPAGKAEMHLWLSRLLEKPCKEYLQFEAALSLFTALSPDEVYDLLKKRLENLKKQTQEMQQEIDTALSQQVPALFLIESQYQQALLQAEYQFVEQFIGQMETETLEGLAAWKDWHVQRNQ